MEIRDVLVVSQCHKDKLCLSEAPTSVEPNNHFTESILTIISIITIVVVAVVLVNAILVTLVVSKHHRAATRDFLAPPFAQIEPAKGREEGGGQDTKEHGESKGKGEEANQHWNRKERQPPPSSRTD
eukprot:761957-Hanusia_phi.AAC.5